MTVRALWTAAEAIEATGGTGPDGWSADGVSIDSRSCAPGDLFVAIVGPSRDAHDYVADALSRGAAAAVVTHRPPDVPADAPLLLVDDTLCALEALGRHRRTRTTAKIVAVTGSAGKTSTKEALRCALAASGPTHASAASYNNQWGVPLSLARLPLDAAYGIFEIGMNHAGEIAALTHQVRPHLALVTTIAPAHLAEFADLAAIARAKAEIFEGLGPGGIALINLDAPHADLLAERARTAGADRVVGFGQDEAAEARLLKWVAQDRGSRVTADVMGQAIAFGVGAPGVHWAMNALAVLAVVGLLGADIAAAAATLPRVSALAGRGRRHDIDTGQGILTLIDESYNANPASVRAALAVLGDTPPACCGRRIAILGDMLELGAEGDALHAALAEPIVAAEVDLVFTCGDGMAHLAAALPPERYVHHGADTAALLRPVLETVRPGDVVMVKGSLGMAMAPMVAALEALAVEAPVHCAGGGHAL